MFESPRIVAAIARLADLPPVAQLPLSDFDIAEIRLHHDDVAKGDQWTAWPADFASRGKPTLLTLRIASEGGTWGDEDRLPIFGRVLPHAGLIDIELRSAILGEVVAHATAQGIPAIGSYHDFQATPPVESLRSLLKEAIAAKVTVLKVAAMVQATDDLWTLASFLHESRKILPTCVIGMGPLGLSSRALFPVLGSCLTYGYLGESTAPGQVSCTRMRELLAEFLPPQK